MDIRRHCAWRARRAAPATRQKGSILIASGVALFVSVVLLASADLGYMFYMKREFQKAADLAALAGAQVLDPASCADATSVAISNANVNLARHGFTLDAATQPGPVRCNRWDPNAGAGGTVAAYEPTVEGYGGLGGQMYFGTPASGYGFNAVKVVIERSVPGIMPFTGSRLIHTEAIALREAPQAVFSVGSRLVRLYSDGLLYNLLKTVGLDTSTLDVLSSAGLANVNVKPSGLLQALGLPATAILDVGTPNEAAALQNLTLGQLLDATITAVGQNSVVQAQVTALQTLRAGLNNVFLDLPVKLFGSESNPGIFAHIKAPDPVSALNADVNLMDLVGTSISVANGDNFVNVPDLNVLGGLVRARVRIVEPPTIGIGGKGTRANNAQIRVYLRLDTAALPLVGTLLAGLGTRVDLPIIIEVAQSIGTVDNLCSAPLEPRQAQISVQSAVANLCIGQFPGMDDPGSPAFFSTTSSCATLVDPHKIITLLGLPVTGKVSAPIFQSGGDGPDVVTLTAPAAGQAPTVVTISPDDNIDLTALIRNLLLGDVRDNTQNGTPTTDAGRTTMAQQLLGPAPGKSLTQVQLGLQQSASSLQNSGLGGVVGLVDNLLNSVGALLGDVVCLLGGYQCKVSSVKNMLQGQSAVGALLGFVVQVLTPVLDALSDLLQNVLNNVLGLGIGETDVSLLSVNCGNARLVY